MHFSPERSRQIADLVLEYDRMIADANAGKSDTWEAVRDELRRDGLKGADVSAEVAMLKAAVAIVNRQALDPLKARKAEEKHEGAEEYVQAINMAQSSHVHVHTREAAEETAPAPPESRSGSASASGSAKAASSDANRDPRPGAGEAAPDSCGSVDGHAGHLEPGTAEQAGLGAPAETVKDVRDTSTDAEGGQVAAEARSTAAGVEPGPQEPLTHVHVHEETARRASARAMDEAQSPAATILAPRIISHPEILDGEPVIANTRVSTTAILHFHEAGYSTEGILEEYPGLRAEDVAAALHFEAALRAKEAHAESTGQDPDSPDYDPLAIPHFLRRTA